MQYEGCSRSWKTAKKRCTALAHEHGHAYIVGHPMYPFSYVIYSSSDGGETPPDTAQYERHFQRQEPLESP